MRSTQTTTQPLHRALGSKRSQRVRASYTPATESETVHPPVDGPVIGGRGAWARDYGLLGVAAGAMGCGHAFSYAPEAVVAATAAGGLTGLVVGLVARTFVERQRRARVPLDSIGVRMTLLGMGWGATWKVLTFLAIWSTGRLIGVSPAELALATLVHGAAGAILSLMIMPWFWLAHTVQSVRRGPTWPAILMAAGIAYAFVPFMTSALRLTRWWVGS